MGAGRGIAYGNACVCPADCRAHARTGLPGWMHVAGKANELGNRRYHLLVRVLISQPKSQDDLALIAKAVNDTDMQNGPKSWAHAQFDRAANGYHAGVIA